MPPSTSTPASGSPFQFRWKLEMAVGLAVVIIILILVSTSRPRQVSGPENEDVGVMTTSVPEVFTDVTGRIESIQGDVLKVSANLLMNNGTIANRTYSVTIGQQTDVRQFIGMDLNQHLEPLLRTQLAAHQRVIVSGEANLRDVTDFTATKVYLYP